MLRSLSLLAIVTLLALNSAPLAADTTSPVISLVTIAPTTVAPWDLVHVAVTATDDVGVAGVTADGIGLDNSAGGPWEGDIPAAAALGQHSVTVVARDAAGNAATDSSGLYKTAAVVGLRIDQAFYPAVAQVSRQYLFKLWGRATYRDESTFTLNDGGSLTAWVTSPGHGVCNDDYVAARGVLDTSIPPAKLTGVQYQILDAAPRQQMTIPDLTIGKNLQVVQGGTLPFPVQLGTILPVTIMSGNAAKARLAKTATGTGTGSIVVSVQPGSSTIPAFYVQGLDSSGTVDVVATAPGCLGKTFTVTLAPSGFGIYAPASFSTTSFSENTQVAVRPAQLHPVTHVVQSWQRLRGGISVSVPVTSADTGVGAISASPVVVSNGAEAGYTQFDPVGPGVSVIAVGVPAGYTTPGNYRQITATVTGPDVLSTNETVGVDLQVATLVHLETAPPAPVDVVVTSLDPGKATLSTDPSVEGTASITFPAVGDANDRTFYVQGRALGVSLVRASALGYDPGTYAVSVNPSGFGISQPSSINTTSFSTNTPIEIRPACLYPTSYAFYQWQRVRGGKSVDVTVTSSNAGVGVVTPSTVTFGSDSTLANTAFDPIGPGAATVSVVPPSGFSAPSNQREITATVTAPDVLGANETVGLDLETPSYVRLATAPPAPVTVTVTVADTSIATLSSSATGDGGASVTFTSVNGIGNNAFYVQGRMLGATTMTCSAPGYNIKTYTITVDPSGFYIHDPNSDMSTTVYSANTTVRVKPARLNPTTLAVDTIQAVRGGKSVSVEVTSSNPATGVITTSPVTFTGGVSSASTAFDPLAVGASTIAVNTPAGFTTPSDNTQRLVTVYTPGFNLQDAAVGRDLQVTSYVSLEAGPPSPVTITVTVGDTSKATLSTDPAVVGSGSITFANVGSTGSKTLYVQGRAVGTTSITASAPGYASATKTVTIDPSGFVIYSPSSITTSVASANTAMQVVSARLNPSTLAYVAAQPVRGGLSLDLWVVSSNTSVGAITVSPLTFGPNTSSMNTAFDPVGVGVTALSAEPPIGFHTPATLRVINATVNP